MDEEEIKDIQEFARAVVDELIHDPDLSTYSRYTPKGKMINHPEG